MSLQPLYEKLAVRNIRIWEEHGALKYKCPAGVFTEELKDEIRKNRQDLLTDLEKKKTVRCAPGYNQKSLWFLNQVEPDSFSYNIVLAFSILPEVDIPRFSVALNRLVQSHSILGSVFHSSPAGGVYIEIEDDRTIEVGSVHLRRKVRWNESEEVRQFCELPFQLNRDLPLRCSVFSAPDATSLLVLVFHHAVCDAISLDVLIQDLFNLYGGGRESGKDTRLEYLDYIDEQISFSLDRARRESFSAYWNETLKTVPAMPEYPFTVERHNGDWSEGVNTGFLLKKDLVEKVESTAVSLGVTKTAVLLSAFETALKHVTGVRNASIGILTSGRTKSRYRRTIGYFVNPVVYPVSGGESAPRGEAIRSVSRKLQGCMEKSEYPFSLVVEDSGRKRELTVNPLFQIAFNHISRQAVPSLADFVMPGERIVEIGGVRVKPWYIPQQNGQFDMTFEVVEGHNGEYWNLKYKKNILSPEQAEDLLRGIQYAAAGTLVTDSKAHPAGETPLVIAANFTAEPVGPECGHWFRRAEMKYRVQFAPYNQVFQELLNPESSLSVNAQGVNVLLIRTEEWLYSQSAASVPDTPPAPDLVRYTALFDEFIQAFEAFPLGTTGPVFVYFLPYSDLVYHNPHLLAAVEKSEFEFHSRFSPAVKVIQSATLKAQCGDPIIDELALRTAHIPFTSRFFFILGLNICRDIWGYKRKPRKVIVLDCDNTLWKGVVAEDGVDGIDINPAFAAFQEQLIHLENRGMVLCLNSKNREEDVLSVFRKRKEMRLSLDHIASMRINWENKSSNILSLAEELNLGPDSFIFIDDNPVECAEVKSVLPGVFVIRMPEDIPDRAAVLANLWPLYADRETAGGSSRTDFYKSDSERTRQRNEVATLSDFIERLNLKVENRLCGDHDLARVSELSLRVNQFNLTGKTYSENEIRAFLHKEHAYVTISKASDKFGDYGIVGACLSEKQDKRFLVDNLVLSCRALGKGIEGKVFTFLGELAQEHKCVELVVPFTDSGRNEPALKALDFYFSAFRQDENGALQYCIPVDYPGKVVPESTMIDSRAKVTSGFSSSYEVYEVLSEELFINIARETVTRGRDITEEPAPGGPAAATYSELIADVWSRVLKRPVTDYQANFFESGGTSLMIPEILSILQHESTIALDIIDVFKYPTVQALSLYCQGISGKSVLASDSPGPERGRDMRNRRLNVQNRFKRVRSK